MSLNCHTPTHDLHSAMHTGERLTSIWSSTTIKNDNRWLIDWYEIKNRKPIRFQSFRFFRFGFNSFSIPTDSDRFHFRFHDSNRFWARNRLESESVHVYIVLAKSRPSRQLGIPSRSGDSVTKWSSSCRINFHCTEISSFVTCSYWSKLKPLLSEVSP